MYRSYKKWGEKSPLNLKQLETMNKQEKQLRVFSKWLKEYDYDHSEYDGKLEYCIGFEIEKATNRIGEYLEEILNMDDEQLTKE